MNKVIIRTFETGEIKPAVKIWLEASNKAHHFIDPAYWESKPEEMENL